MCRQSCLTIVMVSLAWRCLGVSDLSAAEKDESNLVAKARLDVAIKGFESAETVHDMCMWSQRILESEMTFCQSSDDRIAALERQLKRLEKLEKKVNDGVRRENYTVGELREAEYVRLDTQCKLAEVRAGKSLIAK
jgi:hypothetical protein